MINQKLVYAIRLYVDVIINCRLVHAFTCAGIIPSHYIHFCDFAGIGKVGKWYIQSGMHHLFVLEMSYLSVTSYSLQEYEVH